MNSFRYGSPRYWTTNLVLTLAIAALHFCAYTSLWGMAFTAGEGGRSVPAWLGWLVVALGFPVVPIGSYALVVLPHAIHSPILGHGMGLVYLLAGTNALLCGAWTTLQIRIAPGVVRILRRTFAARLASLRA